MASLLVSVRDANEAAEALSGGAAVIDIKEPRRGSLGAADPSRWRQVVRRVGGAVPVSIALGELLDDVVLDRVGCLPPVTYAKVGLAGCRHLADWSVRWQRVMQRLPHHVMPVAVVYGDWQEADSPPPEQVLCHAIAMGCKVLLCDTYGKQRGWLLDHLSIRRLGHLVDTARQHHMRVALAGSVDRKRVSELKELAPDLIAVRGAVCRGQRTARVDRHRVHAMALAVREHRRE